MGKVTQQTKHIRILDLRNKIAKGWTMDQLRAHCVLKLGVSKFTADSYIDEAAEPFRKKYQEQVNANKN